MIRKVASRLLPKPMRRRIRGIAALPPVGTVRFGSLRRTTPISSSFGSNRGMSIDRYYIEDFLRHHGEASGVIRGRVLEVQEILYAEQFGAEAGLALIDVLDIDPDNQAATIIADLTNAPGLPSNAFDCIICTQTLNLIYDIRASVRTLYRILKPGGTVLVTIPGIAQIYRPPKGLSRDSWRVTTASARQLFEEAFQPADITVDVYGNVLTAAAFLFGLAAEELTRSELDVRDPDYQLLVGIKATKSASAV